MSTLSSEWKQQSQFQFQITVKLFEITQSQVAFAASSDWQNQNFAVDFVSGVELDAWNSRPDLELWWLRIASPATEKLKIQSISG